MKSPRAARQKKKAHPRAPHRDLRQPEQGSNEDTPRGRVSSASPCSIEGRSFDEAFERTIKCLFQNAYPDTKGQMHFCATELPWNGGSKVISLWLVNTYFASRLLKSSMHINALLTETYAQSEEALLPEETKAQLKVHLGALLEFLPELGLTFTKSATERYCFELETLTGNEAEDRYRQILHRFIDETSLLKFLFLEHKQWAYFDKPTLFGETVNIAFPSASYDILEPV